jgi:hypothetical protein
LSLEVLDGRQTFPRISFEQSRPAADAAREVNGAGDEEQRATQSKFR